MIGNIIAGTYLGAFSGPTVTGGTLYTSGGYNYRVFTSNGTLSVSGGTLTADVLCIAGGGAGGASGAGGNSGGGGAGGLRYLAAQSLTATNFTITIGAGGASSTSSQNSGNNSSVIGGAISISATGGGAGGMAPSSNGANGGSGGGAYIFAGTFGSGNAGGYSPVEGYQGGSAISTPNYSAGAVVVLLQSVEMV